MASCRLTGRRSENLADLSDADAIQMEWTIWYLKINWRGSSENDLLVPLSVSIEKNCRGKQDLIIETQLWWMLFVMAMAIYPVPKIVYRPDWNVVQSRLLLLLMLPTTKSIYLLSMTRIVQQGNDRPLYACCCIRSCSTILFGALYLQNHETDRDTAAERNFTPSLPHFVSGAVAPAMYVCIHMTTKVQENWSQKDQKVPSKGIVYCDELYQKWIQIGIRLL